MAFEKQEMTLEILQRPETELNHELLKELEVNVMGHRVLILGAHKRLIRQCM